jgi:hypothetical protein
MHHAEDECDPGRSQERAAVTVESSQCYRQLLVDLPVQVKHLLCDPGDEIHSERLMRVPVM